MNSISTIKCFGCGGVVPVIEGDTHEYILSAPGCWQIYSEVLAKDYGEYGYPFVHRITVDGYAVQHPGKPVRKAVQSVAVHLISLFYIFEKNYGSSMATQAMRRALLSKDVFTWLEPPTNMGEITIVDIAKTASFIEYEDMVYKWGKSVWNAWSIHHNQIRKWANP